MLGTDTGGSIRIPSACCGVVGFKPAYGAVPMRGVFPLAPSFDTVGPMARTVADVALVDEVLTGRPRPEPNLAGVRVGVLEGTGIALGLERGPVFEEQIEEVRFPLESDGLFVFYTDGITETMNDTEEQYGEDRIVRILERSRSLPAIQIQQAILDDAAAFRGHAEQYDDVTLTVVKCA